MARVVQQRGNPPFLLIIFVFLFLVAAVLAVLQYLEADKAKKELARQTTELRNLASADELSKPDIQKMMEEYKRSSSDRTAVPLTVIGQYKSAVNRLTTLITGTEKDVDTASAEAAAALKRADSQSGLAPALVATCDKLAAEASVTEAEKTAGKNTAAALKEANDALEKAGKELQEEKEKVNTATAELDAAKTKAQQDYEAKVADIKKDYDGRVDSLNKEISAKADQITALDKKVKVFERERIERGGGPDGNQVDTPVLGTIKPDGTVRSVVPQDNLCYISLGKSKGVQVGSTFSVFAPGAKSDDKPKASIEVTEVMNDVSTCRITSRARGMEVLAGDSIFNITFAKSRSHLFAVAGWFDLQGKGAPNAAGAEEVRAMILRNGGKVSKDVTPQVDYLVVGEAPTKPGKPAEDEPPQVRAEREKQLAEYEAYDKLVKEADKLRVPLLTFNRFLALTGYEPGQSLSSK